MAKPTGFKEYTRRDAPKRPKDQRVNDYDEIELMLDDIQLHDQAARCMDCGIPYCHSYGCPLTNRIPDFNDLVYRDKWREACDVLHDTNNFPEVTGRICPAPCESACTLSIGYEPVTIRHIELQVVEKGFEEQWIVPEPPEEKTGKRIAVIGSGPAGLAVAQQLARLGHDVTVYEKSDQPGGLLRYGIPDFKLEKWVLDRRLDQMRAEGVTFECGVDAGVDISANYLRKHFDATVITAGAGEPRDLKVKGRELDGIHFAMEYLPQQNMRNVGLDVPEETAIDAEGKRVVVIGGGDTGSDCVGTARRQGAKSITQLELLPQPPEDRTAGNPWPEWPQTMRSSTSHEEGCERLWSVLTKEAVDDGQGNVKALRCVKLRWSEPDENGRRSFEEIEGSEFELPADLVLLAMGFVHVEHGPLVSDLELALDGRGNIVVDEAMMTSAEGVFAAGDAVRGASLVVHALDFGRKVAITVDRYVMDEAPLSV